MKKVNRIEQFLLIFAGLLGVACAAVLYFDIPLLPNKYLQKPDQQNEIAVLGSAKNNIKRKIESIPVWEPVGTNVPIYANDHIFTDKESFALIQFKDGSELEVSENSLFKVVGEQSRNTIDFSKGRINVSVKSNDGQLVLKSGNSETLVDTIGSELQVRSDKDTGGAQIQVLQGTAKTQMGGKTLTVKTNEMVTLDKKGKVSDIQKIPIKLVAPARQTKLFGKSVRVVLRWEILDPQASEFPKTLRVAQDAYFEDSVQEHKVTGTELEVSDLEPGEYFWQVTTLLPSGKEVDSESRSFAVYENRRPQLITPPSGEVIDLREMSTTNDLQIQVNLGWQDPAGAKAYQVQVSRRGDFNEPLVDKTFERLKARVKLPPGQYQWRVKALDPLRPDNDYSSASTFSIEHIQLPHPPEQVRPEPNKVTWLETAQQQVTLSWEPAKNAAAYILQVSALADFSKPLLTERIDGVQAVWNPPQAGQYYWRLKPLDNYDRPTEYSQKFPLLLAEKPPALLAPADQAILRRPQQAPQVTFEWQPRKLGQGYRLEVAKNVNFEPLELSKKLVENQFTWEPPANGQFYWRVLTEDTKVSPSATAVKAFRFSYTSVDSLPPPQVEQEYHIELSVEDKPGQVLRSGYGWALLQWPEVQGAASYQVEVATDKGFNRLLVKKSLPQARFLWSKAKPGTFYLRLASVDQFDQSSAFTPRVQLVLTPPAPKLLSPADKTQLLQESKDQPQLASWSSLGNDTLYEVQFAMDSQFSKLVKSHKTRMNQVKVNSLNPGVIWWRVRLAEYREWSEAHSFTLVKQLPAPELISPSNLEIFNGDSAGQQAITLHWKPVEGADKYRVYVSKKVDLSDPVVNLRHQDTQFTFTPEERGTYYWGVRSIGPEFTKGIKGVTRKFLVEKTREGKDLVLHNENGRVLLTNANNTILLGSWEEAKEVEAYYFEVATDPEFKNIIHRGETTKGQFLVEVPTGANYFWRVFTARQRDRRETASVSPQTYGAPSSVQQTMSRQHAQWELELFAGLLTSAGDQESPANTQNVPSGKSNLTSGTAYGLKANWWRNSQSRWGAQVQVVANSGSVEFTPSESSESGSFSYNVLRYGAWGTYWWPWADSLTARLMLGGSQNSRHFVTYSSGTYGLEKYTGLYLSQKGELLWRPRLGRHSLRAGGELAESLDDFTNFVVNADFGYKYHWRNYSVGLAWMGWWQSVDLELSFSNQATPQSSKSTTLEQATFLLFGADY